MTEMCSKCGYADYIHDAGITCTVEDFIRRLERERIIALLLDGWVRENSPIIKELRGEKND